MSPDDARDADELYAWVTTLPDGSTSVVAALLPAMGFTPLVFASRRTADLVAGVAQKHARTHRQPVRLVRFRSEGVLQRFDP